MKIYKQAKVGSEILDIKVEDGKIIALGKFSEDGIHLKGMRVFPGLIDIHVHGCKNHDAMQPEYLLTMSEFWASKGTTSWLPTTMTASHEELCQVVNITLPQGRGANILGFHLEGPYISMKYKGAQNPEFVRNPDIEEFNQLKNIQLVTLAPETEGAMAFIKNCGAKVALGHTDADYACAISAIEAGASCLTHTFNAMTPLHHRNPGVIGAAIEKEIYVQVICDGVHVHPSVVKMLYKTFGPERMILISDALAATGMEDGKYVSGGLDVTVKNGVARLNDGTIAGSTSTLLDCVKKAVSFGIPLEDAMQMASRTPAEYLEVSKGRIAEGYDADFIVLDESLDVVMTVIGGQRV